MVAVIVLVDQDHQISDVYAMNIVGRQTIIFFSDPDRLEEVRAAVGRWSSSDGLIAATLSLQADTVDEAERLLIAMSPHLAGTRFVPDSDPVVDALLDHIRRN